jgi:TPR repeat protein
MMSALLLSQEPSGEPLASIEQTIQWYKNAIITDGNAEALLDLGLCYLKGEGVPVNFIHGIFLMERSAKQGNMAAQYNMGVLYREGRGVEADMDESLRWFRLSAAQGYDMAIDFLSQYEKGN